MYFGQWLGLALLSLQLLKMVCPTHSLQSQPNRPNDVIGDGESSRHRQKPAVTFIRLKFMQEIPKEHFRPVPEAFPDLKLRSNAALQTPAFAGLLEKAGTGPRRQGFRSAIDLHILREFRGQGRPKQTLRQEK